jgi:hypothetical protein
MRVSAREGAEAPASREAKPSRRFGEALRRAAGSPRAGASRAGLERAEPAAAAAADARVPARRRATADRDDGALRERREVFGEEVRLAPTAVAVPPAAGAAEAVVTPELRTLVRTLPLAIQTFGVREGAPLALSFGRSLDVELRPAPRGVELVLRPEPRLARASEAELHGIVAALRARGIAVSRAEVRVRPAGASGSSARVDLAAGVR